MPRNFSLQRVQRAFALLLKLDLIALGYVALVAALDKFMGLLPFFAVTAEPVSSHFLQRHASDEAALAFSGWLLDLCERVAQDALGEVLQRWK